MTESQQNLVSNELGAHAFKATTLAVSVFGAAVFGLGRFVHEAQAQTALQTEISLNLPIDSLRMSAQARLEVEAALSAMSDTDLSLTYARIHATFRDYIGRDDLTVARALCDYALLAEAALTNRGILRPAGTESAREMLLTYELVL